MGCDIHAVIENRIYGSWTSFAEVEIARDYKLFSAIAFGNGGITDDLPYPPRGLPSDHSNRVTRLFFVEADSVDDVQEIATAWGDWAVEQFVMHKIVPQTDWHTPSWLNLGELEIALNHAGLKTDDQSPQFRAVIASMRILSETYGDENVRLVFWFDG
jgi:hypothetical protein